jgi:hypothetical protein
MCVTLREPAQQEKQQVLLVPGPLTTVTDSLLVAVAALLAGHAPSLATLITANDDGVARGYDRRHQNQRRTLHW